MNGQQYTTLPQPFAVPSFTAETLDHGQHFLLPFNSFALIVLEFATFQPSTPFAFLPGIHFAGLPLGIYFDLMTTDMTSPQQLAGAEAESSSPVEDFVPTFYVGHHESKRPLPVTELVLRQAQDIGVGSPSSCRNRC